jgi:chromate transporter
VNALGERTPDRAVPLSEALPVWTKIALLSFGGPSGQIAVMHRELVEKRRWIDEERFLHCMSYCMLLPGPEAQQLATYLGWLLHGTRGGLIAGALFVVPGFVSILLLSLLYAQFHDSALLSGLFGLKPAVMAVVLEALLRIGRRALVARWQALVAIAAFVAIFFFDVPFPAIVASAATLGFLLARRAAKGASHRAGLVEAGSEAPPLRSTLRVAAVWLAIWFIPIALLALGFGSRSIFVAEALFFSKTAVVTFGGAYAVLAYIGHQAVSVYHWLAPGEMLDGLGMAETTPGPLIQVVQFVGYMGAHRHPAPLSPIAAGVLGSIVTAWVTFVPCFLFVFVGAPYAEYLRGRAALQSALSAITAAVVGVILNLAVWFSLHTIFGQVTERKLGVVHLLVPVWSSLSPFSLLLAIGAAVAMLRFRVSMFPTLGAAAALGLLYRLAGVGGR